MIRHAEPKDLTEILRVYDCARAFMRQSGNKTQWSEGYPSAEIIHADIEKRTGYVMESESGAVYAAFALIPGDDPTYAHIEGQWHSTTPYATIHRAGSDGTRRGTFRAIVDFARTRHNHLRADTHADNHPMQECLRKSGFLCCGIIYLQNGDPRLAYEWIAADSKAPVPAHIERSL